MGKKVILNTTIDSDVLNNFRTYCRELGVNMNTVLEVFMNQFSDGEFVFKIGKKMELDIAEDDV